MKILIADDEKNVRRIIGDFLKNDGYEIIEAENGQQALEMLYETRGIQLVLLDVRMPQMDGWETLKEMRQFSNVPVIMVTALNELYDEVKGFNLGASDFITKPFRYEILLARVKACLRLSSAGKPDVIRIETLQINRTSKELYINDNLVNLTLKEFELLEFLAVNANQTIRRETILDKVWGYDCYSDPRTLDTHIKNLRQKLGNSMGLIQTVRGVGYKIVC